MHRSGLAVSRVCVARGLVAKLAETLPTSTRAIVGCFRPGQRRGCGGNERTDWLLRRATWSGGPEQPEYDKADQERCENDDCDLAERKQALRPLRHECKLFPVRSLQTSRGRRAGEGVAVRGAGTGLGGDNPRRRSPATRRARNKRVGGN